VSNREFKASLLIGRTMFRCGYRGGYCEVVNIDPDVKAQLVKLFSSTCGSAIPGQVFRLLEH